MIKTGSPFKIAVEGSGDNVGLPEFDAWRLEVSAVAEILAAIDEQIHSRTQITWRLADLHHSTPTIALQPEWNDEVARHNPVTAVMELWFSAIADLRRGVDPEALGAHALDAVRKALRPIGHGLRSARFVYEQFADSFDLEVANAISRIQFKTEVASEDWEGSLDELNLHNETNTFRLYPAVTRRWITCEFAHDQETMVRSLLQKKVSVFGDAVYRPKEMLPHRIRVKSIEDLDAGDSTPLSGFSNILSAEDTGHLWDNLEECRNGW